MAADIPLWRERVLTEYFIRFFLFHSSLFFFYYLFYYFIFYFLFFLISFSSLSPFLPHSYYIEECVFG